MKQSVPFLIFFVSLAFTSAVNSAKADNWYPSPTGWRGPIRDAGRPWLKGTPYEPKPLYGNPATTAKAPAYYANRWYLAPSGTYYWFYEGNTGTYWYYNPETGAYTYR
jgi:hypothetical protein